MLRLRLRRTIEVKSLMGEETMAKEEKKKCPKKYIFGEYAVGTECFSIVDEGRAEILGDAEGDRKIAVRMYYPVEKGAVEGKERAPIFSEQKAAAIKKEYRMKEIPEDMAYADYYEGVPFPEGEKFPLIMFSMGYYSYVESNTWLLCALASYGYIVASVGHAYEAVENDYEDGSFDLYDRKINKMQYNGKFRAILAEKGIMGKNRSHEESLEMLEAFQDKYVPYIKGRVPEWEKDILKALEAVKERYGEHIDAASGIGASGHSLGGCLAYYLCRYNDEFACGINMDGGLFGDYPEKTMEKPFCQISCYENINLTTRAFLNTNADTYQVVFRNMKHMGFTDAKYYIAPVFSGKLDSDEVLRHLIYIHVRFFDKYLKGLDLPFNGMKSDHIKYRKIH